MGAADQTGVHGCQKDTSASTEKNKECAALACAGSI